MDNLPKFDNGDQSHRYGWILVGNFGVRYLVTRAEYNQFMNRTFFSYREVEAY